MAETFGIVASALSVAALFNNCVDSFEYIQLGRHFGQDYERCQLRLDIARARLGRWGEAIKINGDRRFDSSSPTDKSILLAQAILEEIVLLFESAKKTSKRYELVTDQHDLVVLEDRNMWPVGRGLHNHLKEIVHRRQKNTSLVRKTTWALYDGKNLENIIEKIVGFIDDLENAIPIEAAYHELVEMDIEEVNDEQSLKILQNAAQGIDSALSDAVGQKFNSITSRNLANDVNTEDRARVQVGNTFSDAALGLEILVRDQTANSVERATAKGDSGIQIGNAYGVKGFWD